MMWLCGNLAYIASNTVAKGFACFALHFIPVFEGWLSVVILFPVSILVAAAFTVPQISASFAKVVDGWGVWNYWNELAFVCC
jgi:hypothetical protein